MELEWLGFGKDNIRTLWFLGLVKNCTVGFSPIVSKTPETKRIWQYDKQQWFSVNRTLESRMNPNNSKEQIILTFPIARNPLSNSIMIPRNEKRTPNPVKPSPISVGKKRGEKRFSKSWEMHMHCTYCNIRAEVSQNFNKKYSLLYIMWIVLSLATFSC